MDLTADQFSELPEFLKEQYEETEGVYKSLDSLKFATVKQTADKLDKDLKAARGEFATLKETFDAEQSQKAEQLKAAKDKALEDATSKGETEQVKELYAQKMADLEQRSYERGKSEAANEYKSQSLAKDAQSLRTNLAVKLARDEGSQEAISMLLSGMIKPTDDGVGFFDAAGSALSITDVAEFEKEIIKKSLAFKWLIKPDVIVSGGGLASGGSASYAQKQLSQMSEKERVDLKKSNPQLFKQLIQQKGK